MYICHITKTEARKSRKSYFHNCVLIKNWIILITAILIKKLGKVAMGITILDWCPCLSKKMDGAYKKLVYQMRRVIFGLLGLSPQNCNLGLKTAICIELFRVFRKTDRVENKTSTSQDYKLNFGFYLIKKY